MATYGTEPGHYLPPHTSQLATKLSADGVDDCLVESAAAVIADSHKTLTHGVGRSAKPTPEVCPAMRSSLPSRPRVAAQMSLIVSDPVATETMRWSPSGVQRGTATRPTTASAPGQMVRRSVPSGLIVSMVDRSDMSLTSVPWVAKAMTSSVGLQSGRVAHSSGLVSGVSGPPETGTVAMYEPSCVERSSDQVFTVDPHGGEDGESPSFCL